MQRRRRGGVGWKRQTASLLLATVLTAAAGLVLLRSAASLGRLGEPAAAGSLVAMPLPPAPPPPMEDAHGAGEAPADALRAAVAGMRAGLERLDGSVDELEGRVQQLKGLRAVSDIDRTLALATALLDGMLALKEVDRLAEPAAIGDAELAALEESPAARTLDVMEAPSLDELEMAQPLRHRLAFVARQEVDFRTGPGRARPVGGRLRPGEVVLVDLLAGGWHCFESEHGVRGCVAGRFLRPARPSD